MKEKELIQKVAQKLGRSEAEVSLVTDAWVEEIIASLKREESVNTSARATSALATAAAPAFSNSIHHNDCANCLAGPLLTKEMCKASANMPVLI
jgi:hypothetical protein